MEEHSGLRAFLAKCGVVLDPATVGARALEELEEKYLIARDLDVTTVLSRIQAVVERNDGSILNGGELSYQLPLRAPEQVEYDPSSSYACTATGSILASSATRRPCTGSRSSRPCSPFSMKPSSLASAFSVIWRATRS